MFERVLIANRGAIACRISRTLRKLGVSPIAVYSEADRHAPHVAGADLAVLLGPAPAAQSYLDIDKIIEAAQKTNAEAIHPGYGFLSENAAFAERCEALGIAFIGPTPQQMRDFGLKHVARSLAQGSGLPLLPGTGLLADVSEALREAKKIGYPVMLKSTAGGGGIGMKRCASEEELVLAFAATDRLARTNFKQAGLYLEKLVAVARHVEVQIFGDGAGKVVALGERDCSVQRRHQKVLEETPAPRLERARRDVLLEGARRLATAAQYRSAGTVEYVVDDATGEAFFLEVNTRIQVEHGVTEEVTGVDLIEWMVRLAAGELPDLDALVVEPRGAAIEARIYAEDPRRDFLPSAGVLVEASFGDGVRVETWVERGTEVTPFYDPMLAKIIARGTDRADAIRRLAEALAATTLAGIETNREYIEQILQTPEFLEGRVHTRLLEGFAYRASTFDVLEPGTQTTVQDYPGRLGYWDVGVPPSGPMDALSFRLANRVVGNPESAAGLECTLVGPSLRFNIDAVIALAGADMGAELDGQPIRLLEAVAVMAGSVLTLGAVCGPGSRAYVAFRGGIDVPLYLASRATFTLGLFGGHAGRALAAGDVVHLAREAPSAAALQGPLPAELVPVLGSEWVLEVLEGPHAAPDFFTVEDIAVFFSTTWKVHYNSSRTGVRLVGPKPKWARQDGGEAGLHPSNIHDNAYAIGTVDFTGDMPVILGPDGPSLGGFVCPATIVKGDLWKIGQLKAGDTVRFHKVTLERARALAAHQERALASLTFEPLADVVPSSVRPSPVIGRVAESDTSPSMTIRQDGDSNLLVEYGPMVLDLALRFRVQAMMEWFAKKRMKGIIDLVPGIRSLQVHYDDTVLRRERLLEAIAQAESELPATAAIEVPSRIVRLPLSWEDPATLLAIRKYMQSVRPDAPWCPSNIEFIRRINGLESVDEVKQIVFAASYLVLGLGDVYLGAPVATPIDPRHRLVTTKYNPARTWTPENAVGIGGAYLCVYGMEGPGGYQFVGRTCQMWNRHRPFAGGKPWLLRFFDQIRFYPVSEKELLEFREAFPRGRVKLDVEPTTFRLADYQALLKTQAEAIGAFKAKQVRAFEEERERWALLPPLPDTEPEPEPRATEVALGPGQRAVRSQVAGSVWQVLVAPGDRVKAGDKLVILETMKMETVVTASQDGTVDAVPCKQGSMASAGTILVVLGAP
ncbi:MAG TPA: urea carboxylase [Polyangiaceae bacterium]|nr:urea carboxylase [Polyangiaceae bacterium]